MSTIAIRFVDMEKDPTVRLGPIGENARRNVTRLRTRAGYSLAELSNRMTGERQLSLSGLSKLETGGRKIDVDDLVAIAAALDVSPLAILFGESRLPEDLTQVGGTSLEARSMWRWAIGETPITDNDQRGFQARSLPWWLRVDSGEVGEGAHPDSRAAIYAERVAEVDRQLELDEERNDG